MVSKLINVVAYGNARFQTVYAVTYTTTKHQYMYDIYLPDIVTLGGAYDGVGAPPVGLQGYMISLQWV